MDLCIRAAKSAGRVVCVPEMRMVHLGEPRTFRAVVRRHAWHGRGAELFYSNGRVCFVTISTVAFADRSCGEYIQKCIADGHNATKCRSSGAQCKAKCKNGRSSFHGFVTGNNWPATC